MGSLGNCCVNFFTDKARLYRYAALVAITLMGLGGYICVDSVGSLQEPLMEHLELSAADFSLIYSIGSWPNVILCFFGGFLIDRFFGIKWGAIIYAIIMTCGHILFSFGTLLGQYWLVLLGRFIYGLGSEVMYICIQCYGILWFKGKELSMVACIIVSSGRLGTSIMYEMAYPLYNAFLAKAEGKQAVGFVFFVAGLAALMSVCCGFIMKSMDPKKYVKLDNDSVEPMTGDNHVSQEQKISVKDILKFPLSYWLIVVTFSSFITSVYALIPLSQVFFMTNFGLSIEAANNVTSFFSILSAVLGPFIGIIVDRYGKLIFCIIVGMLNIFITHLLLIFASASPYIAMCIMTIGFCLTVSAVFPMISFVIPDQQLGTSFGVNMALMNLTISANLIVIGHLIDSYDFTAMEYYLLAWTVFGIITSSLLWFQDRREMKVLNMSKAERDIYTAELAKKDETKSPLKV